MILLNTVSFEFMLIFVYVNFFNSQELFDVRIKNNSKEGKKLLEIIDFFVHVVVEFVFV